MGEALLWEIFSLVEIELEFMELQGESLQIKTGTDKHFLS